MDDIDLRIGTYPYDTTRALFDGSVRVEGVRADIATAPTLPEIFAGLLDRRYDVGEFGLTFLLRAREQGVPLVAIPAFPNRVFRHSCVYVSVAAGIRRPEDLVGRTIGEFGVYGQDSGVWAKGILADDYGFAPERNRWVIGGLDHPAPPFGFVPHPHPAEVEVSAAPDGATLSAMLEAGDIDALFTANVPQPYLDGSPRVARLFEDYESVERDHFRRNGIFPIMHTVVAHADVLAAHPGLAGRIFDGYLAAKDVAAQQYRRDRRLYQVPHMLPWTSALFERNRDLLGEDWWPYGLAANRAVLDTYLRYHHEQGLSARRWTIEELFSPEFL